MLNKAICTFLLLFSFSLSKAHLHHYPASTLHQWTMKSGERIEGSFLLMKNNVVYLEKADGLVEKKQTADFSPADLVLVLKKQKLIEDLNGRMNAPSTAAEVVTGDLSAYGKTGVLLLVLAIITFLLAKNKLLKRMVPAFSLCTAFVFFSFEKPMLVPQILSTDPLSIDSAFTPFKPEINTSWNATYFLVESKGIPLTHQMMAGIADSGWQRQVPIPQCYTGANSWSIPLNPVIAASPVPVNQNHFTKGAIAIAVNGVPVFNPYTNTGADAFLAGQLDTYGGHSGRADDYHYHIAPLHLYSYTSAKLPVAYAFDGFAVYGSSEPDGSAMQTLDANHGHYWTNGVYHYHGSAAAPYMIGNMVGQVTEDASLQIVPQAAASAVRPPQNPLPGALISSCTANSAGNGYNLTYTLSGQTDSLVYSWTSAGVYDFKFYTPTTYTDSTYNGFVQCEITSGLGSVKGNVADMFTVFPNPGGSLLGISVKDETVKADVLYTVLYNAQGKEVKRLNGYVSELKTAENESGVYFVRFFLRDYIITKRIVLNN